jgi:hypothetical protein
MNTDSMPAAEIITSSAGDDRGALVAGELGIGAQAAQHIAEAGLVRAALGRRDGVAVGIDEAVAAKPRHRPFDRRGRRCFSLLPAKISRVTWRFVAERGGEVVLQAAGEMETAFGRRRVFVLDQRRDRRSFQRISTPPNR